MEATCTRHIADGHEYDHLIGKAKGGYSIAKQRAGVDDTVELIKKVVKETAADTKLLAKELEGKSLRQTLTNIWQFVYRHVRYKKDKDGVEEVRRPARVWADRQQGVDCDCYTTFISSVLYNLKITHTYRVTEYKNKGFFQHIYPIVPLKAGHLKRQDYIVLDVVKDRFDEEEPYTNKKDYTMIPLAYLDGLPDSVGRQIFMDSQTLGLQASHSLYGLEDYEIDGLGRVHGRRRGKRHGRRGSSQEIVPAPAKPTTNPLVKQIQAQSPSQDYLVIHPDGTVKTDFQKVNKGVLANGQRIEMDFNANPKVTQDGGYQVTIDGKPSVRLWRLVVKDGVARGFTRSGTYMYNAGKGWKNLSRDIGSWKSTHPPVFGLDGSQGDSYSNSQFDSLFEIDGLSGALGANPNANRFGLYVPYNILQELWGARKKYSGSSTDGLAGLYSLYGLLGPAFDILAPTIEEIQGKDLDELEDVAGINGLLGEFGDEEFELSGINGEHDSIDLLEHIGSEKLATDEQVLYVVDGLGRVRRTRGRRNRRSGRGAARPQAQAMPSTKTADQSVANTSIIQQDSKHLGLYVPLNTLKNLLKIRGTAIEKLQTKGNTVSPGTVPSTIDGMSMGEVAGFTGLNGRFGKWLKKTVKQVGDKGAAVIRKNPALISMVPGGGAIAVAAVKALDRARTIKNAIVPKPMEKPTPALQPTPDMLKYDGVIPMKSHAPYLAESTRHYTSIHARGMGEAEGKKPNKLLEFVKEKPLVAAGGGLLAAGGIWYLLDQGKKNNTKGLSGMGKRKSGKRKPSSKRKTTVRKAAGRTFRVQEF